LKWLESREDAQGVRKIKDAEKAYRIRVGGYRVVYDVSDNGNWVLILLVPAGARRRTDKDEVTV